MKRFRGVMRGLIVVFVIFLITGVLWFGSLLVTGWQAYFPPVSIIELDQSRSGLIAGEAAWQANGLLNYDIDVTAFIPLGCSNYGETLHVRNGELVNEDPDCRFAEYLPPQVFETLKQNLAHMDPMDTYASIQFDPEYGFVSNYSVTCMNVMVTDCGTQYTFTNFEPIEP